MTGYSIKVPAGATNLQITTSGGTGDVDLYVKAGSAPTTTSYDCRPTAPATPRRASSRRPRRRPTTSGCGATRPTPG
ncbi:PPC domain-containing protein [Arsenicicoccus sp. oral taxon 190]|uniref:PPC domain-containing protein n=1 Tax=Arsenicicoccus sp. oral taxon 190 TaxID=1658671 RepID=UPI00345F800D